MKLAIDLRFNQQLNRESGKYLQDILMAMLASKPHHQFLILTNKGTPNSVLNNNGIIIKEMNDSRFGWFQQKKLIRLLQEFNAAGFIQMSDRGFDLFKANASGFSKKQLQVPHTRIRFLPPNNPGVAESIEVFIKPLPINDYPDFSWAQSESIKTRYTGGRDYFLFAGPLHSSHSLIELLKAFSVFKKWQQSNMQLVLAGRETDWTETLEEKLSNYKYKADVVLLKNLPEPELAGIIAASYAILYPEIDDRIPIELMQAVRFGKASIVSDTTPLKSITQAAIWINNHELQEGFAQAMIQLYKDEKQKTALQEMAKQENLQYGWPQLISEFWQVVYPN